MVQELKSVEMTTSGRPINVRFLCSLVLIIHRANSRSVDLMIEDRKGKGRKGAVIIGQIRNRPIVEGEEGLLINHRAISP